jgi:preprotein translocase subunit YajC
MLITPAYAQAAAGGDANSMLMSLLPFALIFVIMYFLILRPQQKKVKDHAELVKNIRRGDTVVTSGGLVGKVTKVVDDDQIEFEISDGVRVRQMRQMISGVRAKGEPAKEKAEAKDAMEGAGDHSDRADRLPVRRSQLLSSGAGEDLAGVGAAAHRARPRSAGRLVFAARSRFQLREEGKARSGARRSPSRAARGQDRLYRSFCAR